MKDPNRTFDFDYHTSAAKRARMKLAIGTAIPKLSVARAEQTATTTEIVLEGVASATLSAH